MAGTIDHSTRAHAICSASGSHKWLHCTVSPRLELRFPEKRSVYADEGTLAHEISDIYLRLHFGKISKSVFDKEIRKLRRNKLYYKGMEIETSHYVNYVIEKYNESVARSGKAWIYIEERLDFSHIVQDGFGTGDILILSNDGILDVIDLKFGKRVQVSAQENSQLMLYGCGAIRKFEMMYDVNLVRMHIVQPRLSHIDVFELPAEALEAWGLEYVKPKAELAYKGEGTQTTGEWCRFCKAKAICRAFSEKNLDLAKLEFRDPHVLSDEEIIYVHSIKDQLSDWSKEVSAYMLDTAKSGKTWQGFKLVAGKSERSWTNEVKVAKVLDEQGYLTDEYTVTKLAGITAIESLVGKDKFPILFKGAFVKPEGVPTLVPLSDKRPALGLEQAKRDFADPLD